MRTRGEGGQALPLVLLIVALAAVTALALGRTGADAVAAARARTAADAAALAGAAAGPDAATALARANGAAPAVTGGVGEATVTARLGSATATARAQGPPPTAGAGTEGLVPELVAALARATALLGEPVPITSGWRSYEEQAALWAARATNLYPVAPPGTSRHEQGLAVDVPSAFAPRLAAVGPVAGLCRPLPLSDPVHFELCRTPT